MGGAGSVDDDHTKSGSVQDDTTKVIVQIKFQKQFIDTGGYYTLPALREAIATSVSLFPQDSVDLLVFRVDDEVIHTDGRLRQAVFEREVVNLTITDDYKKWRKKEEPKTPKKNKIQKKTENTPPSEQDLGEKEIKTEDPADELYWQEKLHEASQTQETLDKRRQQLLEEVETLRIETNDLRSKLDTVHADNRSNEDEPPLVDGWAKDEWPPEVVQHARCNPFKQLTAEDCVEVLRRRGKLSLETNKTAEKLCVRGHTPSMMPQEMDNGNEMQKFVMDARSALSRQQVDMLDVFRDSLKIVEEAPIQQRDRVTGNGDRIRALLGKPLQTMG